MSLALHTCAIPAVAPTLRQCTFPGCSERVEQGACAKHRRPERDIRESASNRGYDRAHQALATACFIRDHWQCKKCGWMLTIVEDFARLGVGLPPVAACRAENRQRRNDDWRHLHADHVIPVVDRPDLRLVLENYQALCNECHSRKTRRENGR